jgi:DNA repair exonuclease SbcCD nuclease subunit
LKILATGDLHIGRGSSRIPPHLDGRSHSAVSCWERIVDCALLEGVNLVALSGDIVDQDNGFYEAAGPLEAGLRRLAAHGIQTIAVAGNHDHDVLPRLAGNLPSAAFRLLGQGGRWERTRIQRGEFALEIDGWSFPGPRVRDSPLVGHEFPESGSVPVLRLLHGDLGQPRSPYAPLALAELQAAPPGFWLLGHIHAPALYELPGHSAVLYPGSPQALDPGEPGLHGVWIIELRPGPRFSARQIPLSTIRYESLGIDLTGIDRTSELERCLTSSISTHLDGVLEVAGPLRCLSLRLRLHGRTALHRLLEAELEQVSEDYALPAGEVVAVIERIEYDTRPALDLTALAGGNDAPAILARLILSLEGEGKGVDPEFAQLLQDAGELVSQAWHARPYLPLRGEEGEREPAADTARLALRRQATLLLDQLLAQKGES